MLKNYLLIAFRSIQRNFSYAFLNVSGLTLSIASCLVIFLIVRNELSYDSFHKKADRTYRVTMNALDFNPSVSMAIAPAMRTDFPELEQVSQYWYQGSGMVKVGQNRYSEKGYAYADGHFTDIFDYEWLAGNPRTALTAPNTVVLTESIAHKYFGDGPAMGQVIQLDNEFTLSVTGIIKDPPGNSHLHFIFLVSFETVKPQMATSEFYAIAGGNTFIVAPAHYSVRQMERKMPSFIAKNWGKDIAGEAKLLLQPLQDIHFDQRYLHNADSPTTSRNTYRALAVVALFIIITACINFINLATAQAMKRAKEVGVRKTLGADRWQLIRQFLGETALLVLVAVLLGAIIAYVCLPQTAKWLDIRIDAGQLGEPAVLGLLATLTLVIILLAGLYPAFVQSAFRPIDSLKNKTGISYRGLTLRKSLVLLQFAISQILIAGTLIVARQMDFFKNQDLGFNKEAVIAFFIPDMAKRDVLRGQLQANPGVKGFSFSSGAPVYNSSFAPFSSPELGITKDDVTEIKFVDEQYTGLFEMKMLAGEKISKKHEGDTVQKVVVNEMLVHKLGIPTPAEAIGKHINIAGQHATIMGVVQDFQSESKHKKRRPCILIYNPQRFFSASVKIQPQQMQRTINRVEQEWSQLFPEQLFQYEFLDDRIASLYRQEQKVYTAFRLFSFLAILIGCLGLYGLVAFAAVQRTKEVGIRKVMGASLLNIVVLFSKEFMILIAIAFVVSAPVAYYIMHKWLESFAYQIGIGSDIFLIAIGVSVAIAAITIGYQSFRAALANPLKSLRTE